jgi:polyhydroxyalkanoate synthase
MADRLAPPNVALQQIASPLQNGAQHKYAPRPLPLFLSLVGDVARDDPALARRALAGLARYGEARRAPLPPGRPAIARVGGASLRDLGGNGSTVVLIPSLINPPLVLDLPGASLAEALVGQHRVLLVDWGFAAQRAGIDLGGHVEQLLIPLLATLGALAGYCLGGTMALAAANLAPVARVATLAAPWDFDHYPREARNALGQLWERSVPTAQALGVLPTEVLQVAFWSLDPRGIVAKYARLADEPAGSVALARFVTLEDWANDGEPLPRPAARELIETLFIDNEPGKGTWRVGGTIIRPDAVPALHFTAKADRIVPSSSAPPGERHAVPAGHVGMVVGSRARESLHRPLLNFLA